MNEEEYNQKIMEEVEALKQEEMEDGAEDQYDLNRELQEAYGYPEAEEKMNTHSFLHKAAFDSKDTVRTTFLHEGELGRPLFTVRFLMDLKDISKYYFDDILKKLGKDSDVENKIANYFEEKLQNITASGMSNKGFVMNLNVTKRVDATRLRKKEQSSEKEVKTR